MRRRPRTGASFRHGFTLVELLTVMGIIALLLALVVPGLGKARALARRTACRAGLHGVGVAFRQYLNDNNDFMPVAAQLPSMEPELPRIADVLAPYLQAPEALRCPADTKENYFAREGSSYEYPSMLRGRRVDQTFLGKRWGEPMTPVMYDYKPFHGKPGTPGASNFLFADGHVGDLQ